MDSISPPLESRLSDQQTRIRTNAVPALELALGRAGVFQTQREAVTRSQTTQAVLRRKGGLENEDTPSQH